jgi:hypothetical protein
VRALRCGAFGLMCGILPMAAMGASKRDIGAAAIGGLGGLALSAATKNKKPKPMTGAEKMYGANTSGA